MDSARTYSLGSLLASNLLTFAVIAAVELLAARGIDLPNPGVAMSLAVVFASFFGGMISGFLSSLIAIAFSIFYMSTSSQQLYRARPVELLVLSICLPIMAVMVGGLKNRAVINAQKETRDRVMRQAETSYRQLIDAIHDYAIIRLDPQGTIVSWNEGAQRLNGYTAQEILGKNVAVFYPKEELVTERVQTELSDAKRTGRFEDEGWRVKKDGTRFWANVIVSSIRDPETKKLSGYVKITRDLSERRRQEEKLRETSIALSSANKELEAFSYSVSHDLRSPLRSIDGFSQALMEDYYEKLDDEARDYLRRIRSGTQRMGKLIDDLLTLSRLGRAQMHLEQINLSQIAEHVTEELRASGPKRNVQVTIQPGIFARGDAGLLSAVFENLLSNAWKFTSKKQDARIEFGATELNGETVYFVEDNGAGFDMAYADKLFGAFQRLHRAEEFEGTGVGLATVRRIILRHGGRIWVKAQEGKGAIFYFTLGLGQRNSQAA